MARQLIIVSVLLLGTLTTSCGAQRQSPTDGVKVSGLPVPYDLSAPDAVFTLPNTLLEISGLTVLDSLHLGAVQDELGILYVLDRETAEVVSEHRFAGRGDYEGLERVGDTVWVLRSDGVLFAVRNTPDQSDGDIQFDLRLHKSCDAEGLASSTTGEHLLLVCKEHPGGNFRRVRSIYSIAISTRPIIVEPIYLIDREELEDGRGSFKPSALAVHPQSNLLYVLSSVNKMLVVLDTGDSIRPVSSVELPDRLFPQPEGIAFFPDGTLFISNEGRNGQATLLRFDLNSNNP